MRRWTLLGLGLLLAGCHATASRGGDGGDVPPAGCALADGGESSTDPRLVSSVHCLATDGKSDAVVDIGVTCRERDQLSAHVVQHKPKALERSFTSVTGDWTGDFYNFLQFCPDHAEDFGCVQFSLLARPGKSTDHDNFEINQPELDMGLLLEVDQLACTVQ